MVVVLLIEGDQVPVTPLLEVVGSVKELPKQKGPIAVNDGTTDELIVTFIVAVDAHCPEVGVNV